MHRILLASFAISVLLSLTSLSHGADNTTTIVPDLNGCSDDSSECYKYKGQCTPRYPVVLKMCKKTCNRCPTPPPKATTTPEASGNATSPADNRSTTQANAISSTPNLPYSTPTVPPKTHYSIENMGTLCTAGPVTWLGTVLWIINLQ